MSNLVVVGAYSNYVEASIVKERLISEGILAVLQDENLLTINPLYSIAAGGVKVMVHRKDTALAKEILDQTAQMYKRELVCSACGSDQVHFVSSGKDAKNFLALIPAFILSVFPFYNKKVYRCDRCGYETEFMEE